MSFFQRRLVFERFKAEIPELQMIGRYNYKKAESGLLPHFHKGCMEFCYLERGHQQYRVGEKVYRMSGGDLFFTRPDEVHGTGNEPQEKGTLYWLILSIPRKGGSFPFCERSDSDYLCQRLLSIPERLFPGDLQLKSCLESILVAAQTLTGSHLRLVIRKSLMDFLLGVIRCSEVHQKTQPSGRLRDLVSFIEANSHRRISISEMAARTHLSIPRLKQRFKEEWGMPPAEFAMRRRIELARIRLKEPGTSVTDVAFDLGFPSSQYFATVFRRYVGSSPSSYLANLTDVSTAFGSLKRNKKFVSKQAETKAMEKVIVNPK